MRWICDLSVVNSPAGQVSSGSNLGIVGVYAGVQVCRTVAGVSILVSCVVCEQCLSLTSIEKILIRD